MSVRHPLVTRIARPAWVLCVLLALFAGACGEDSGTTTPEGDRPAISSMQATAENLAQGESTNILVRVCASKTSSAPAAGVSVQFAEAGRATLGSFDPQTAVTDADGWASTMYTPPVAADGRVDVKAMIPGDVEYLSLFVSDEGPSDAGLAIVLDAPDSWLPADGVSTLEITILVSAGGVALAGEEVVLAAGEAFDDVDGDGVFGPGDAIVDDRDDDGEWDAVGSIAPLVTTGADGRARAMYTAGNAIGPVAIKATVDSVFTDLVITLESGAPVITVSASPVEALANGFDEATVTAEVRSPRGEALAGRLVRFTAGEPFEDLDHDGYYTPGEAFTDRDGDGHWSSLAAITSWARTDAGGNAEATLTAGRRALPVTVYASTSESRGAAEIALFELPRVAYIQASWSPERVYADGVSTATLTLAVTDINRMPIAGKEIFFSATMGTIDASAITGRDGVLTAVYRAPATPGDAVITASAGDWSMDLDPFPVDPLPSVTALELSAHPEEIRQTGIADLDRATLSAACFIDGDPAPAGIAVVFAVESGPGGGEGLAPGATASVTATTDATGVATAELLAGTLAGAVEVSATCGSAADRASVAILGSSIGLIELTANPAELSVLGVGGVDTAELTLACFASPSVPAYGRFPVSFSILSRPEGGTPATIVDYGDEADVTTDENGIARVLLRSGTASGPITIAASAGELSQTLYLGVSAGPAAGIECWADSTRIPLGGECVFHARVFDEQHNPVPDGSVVVFTADTGLIYTEHGTGSMGTENGVAEATYAAPQPSEDAPEVATLTCSVDGAAEPLVCTATIELGGEPDPIEPGPIARLALTLSVPEIAVHLTGGQEQCRILALCTDQDQVPVGPNREVEFEITAGPGGGERLQNAGWGPVIARTNTRGEAEVTLSSGTVSGTVQLIARAGEAASQSALVSIAAGPPAYISLGAEPLNIRGWDVVGAEASVVAYVSDRYNNPVRDNTVVYFTCDEGIMRGNYQNYGELGSSVTEGGAAIGSYFSGEPRLDGRVEIVASTSGGTVRGTTWLISSGPAASVRFLSPAPPVSLLANGQSEVKFWVEVLDINDNFVVEGTRVDWSTDFGEVDESSLTSDGVSGSVASAVLKSALLEQDFSYSVPDDGVGARARLNAETGLAGGVADQMEVAFRTGSAYRGNSRIEVEETIPTGSSVPFEVLIKDRYGNPLGGHALSLSVSGGGSVTPQATTDSWGSAYPLTFTAPASDTTCVITVIDNDPGFGGGLTLSARIAVE